MKKVVSVVMLLLVVLIGGPVFAAGSASVVVSGTVASNLSLTMDATTYTLKATGASAQELIGNMLIKSNAKTSFTLGVTTLNAANGSFNAKATVTGTATGAVLNWPYKLYLKDGTNTSVELTTVSPGQTFTRKTVAAGDSFGLYTTYDSAESLNLDAGTYSDTITITLTAN